MKIDLASQSWDEARARLWLGSGWRYPFTLGERQGELYLLPAPERDEDGELARGFQSDAGLLIFSNPSPLLTLLANCPALMGEDDSNDNWYWPFFSQQLSPQIVDLFGPLTRVLTEAKTAPCLTLRLSAYLGEEHAWSNLHVTPQTLQQLANRPGWQRRWNTLHQGIPLNLPLIVATLTLSVRQLAALRCGDLLMPGRLFFTPQGQGYVTVARQQFQGQLTATFTSGEPDRFLITLKKELTMSHSQEPLLPEDDRGVSAAGADEETKNINVSVEEVPAHDASFDELPLELTLRCGTLKLTLGELRQLDAGSTVLVEHASPGEALLCHGNFPLAKGELVNVNGSLGLQITRVLCNQPHAADGSL